MGTTSDTEVLFNVHTASEDSDIAPIRAIVLRGGNGNFLQIPIRVRNNLILVKNMRGIMPRVIFPQRAIRHVSWFSIRHLASG